MPPKITSLLIDFFDMQSPPRDWRPLIILHALHFSYIISLRADFGFIIIEQYAIVSQYAFNRASRPLKSLIFPLAMLYIAMKRRPRALSFLYIKAPIKIAGHAFICWPQRQFSLGLVN